MARTFTLVVLLVIVALFALSYMTSTGYLPASSLALSAAPPSHSSSGRGVAAPVGGSVSSSSILGPPSLSVDFLNRVLAAYHSPAAGLGSVLYQDSVTYGIDDAYALAFFLHESSMGNVGMAHATHSLGNIRCTPGWSCLGGYRYYATWAAGFLDWFRLMRNEYLPRHLSTVPSIIPVYAPSADHNDEHGYIAAVLSAVSAWRVGRVVV